MESSHRRRACRRSALVLWQRTVGTDAGVAVRTRGGDDEVSRTAGYRVIPFKVHAVPAGYAYIEESGFVRVADQPLSTFSIDVDTASYSNVRRFLNDGALPPPDAVRIEELINYFGYDYPRPAGNHPFSITLAEGACPWNAQHRLNWCG